MFETNKCLLFSNGGARPPFPNPPPPPAASFPLSPFPLSPFPRWDVGMKKWDFWLISIILLLFIISLPLLGINIGLCVKQFDMNGDAKCQIDDNILHFNPIQTWGWGRRLCLHWLWTFITFFISKLKDVRANCFCASLLRTQFTSWCHATSCIKRAPLKKCGDIQR